MKAIFAAFGLGRCTVRTQRARELVCKCTKRKVCGQRVEEGQRERERDGERERWTDCSFCLGSQALDSFLLGQSCMQFVEHRHLLQQYAQTYPHMAPHENFLYQTGQHQNRAAPRRREHSCSNPSACSLNWMNQGLQNRIYHPGTLTCPRAAPCCATPLCWSPCGEQTVMAGQQVGACVGDWRGRGAEGRRDTWTKGRTTPTILAQGYRIKWRFLTAATSL